jgi:hypothetical protein
MCPTKRASKAKAGQAYAQERNWAYLLLSKEDIQSYKQKLDINVFAKNKARRP